MSMYGPINFKLVMGEYKIEKKPEIPTGSQSKNSEPLVQYIPLLFNALFQNYLPSIKTKDDMHKFILEISKIEEDLTLNEKYIFSLNLAINKNFLTQEILNDILEEEFHLTLMKWLMKDKNIVEEKNENEIYKFNIYIGLLINIITLFEIFPIKSKDLSEFNLYKKLFKLNSLIQLNINNCFPFLFSLNNLLKKWKKQIDNYLLYNSIDNLTIISQKTKRLKDKEFNSNNNHASDTNEKDRNSTEPDSEEKEEAIVASKKNKKVRFDLYNIQKFVYDKNKSPSEDLNLNENKGYELINLWQNYN